MKLGFKKMKLQRKRVREAEGDEEERDEGRRRERLEGRDCRKRSIVLERERTMQ